MGDLVVEVDGASLSTFAGGRANFTMYRGQAYQVDDEKGRFVCLTPAQIIRMSHAVFERVYPGRFNLNPPAFPGGDDHSAPYNDGLLLADYVAAKVMQGLIEGSGRCQLCDPPVNDVVEQVARMCYQYADAFMRARGARKVVEP